MTMMQPPFADEVCDIQLIFPEKNVISGFSNWMKVNIISKENLLKSNLTLVVKNMDFSGSRFLTT